MMPDINEISASASVSARHFVKLLLCTKEKIQKTVQGILVFDLDDTVLNFVESCNQKKTVFHYEQQLKEVMHLAASNDFLIVVATARSLEDDHVSPPYLRGSLILRELSAHIKEIYFTSLNSKKHVLEHLNTVYFKGSIEGKRRIMIVDDQPNNIYECFSAGFRAIQVEPSNTQYLEATLKFLMIMQENPLKSI